MITDFHILPQLSYINNRYLYTGKLFLHELEILTIAKVMALADMLLVRQYIIIPDPYFMNVFLIFLYLFAYYYQVESLRMECERYLLQTNADWTADDTLWILYLCHYCNCTPSIKEMAIERSLLFR